jgi:hypothetical protein
VNNEFILQWCKAINDQARSAKNPLYRDLKIVEQAAIERLTYKALGMSAADANSSVDRTYNRLYSVCLGIERTEALLRWVELNYDTHKFDDNPYGASVDSLRVGCRDYGFEYPKAKVAIMAENDSYHESAMPGNSVRSTHQPIAISGV